MESVTVSKKYQVMIPESIRKQAGIKPGDKMAVIVKHRIIHYVPIGPLESLNGLIPGLNNKDLREKQDRF